uniref:Uncharacterized protein n=1 Tax=Arundo donax TaxID=35708 RepID=A0A0A9A3K5_ARUDO
MQPLGPTISSSP